MKSHNLIENKDSVLKYQKVCAFCCLPGRRFLKFSIVLAYGSNM